MKYKNNYLLTASCLIKIVTTVINMITHPLLWNATPIATLEFIRCTRSRSRCYTYNLRISSSQNSLLCETRRFLLWQRQCFSQISWCFPTIPGLSCSQLGGRSSQQTMSVMDICHFQAQEVRKQFPPFLSSPVSATLKTMRSGWLNTG